MKYRIVSSADEPNLWCAEERTSFGWERVMFTFAQTSQAAEELLKNERKDA